MAILRSSVSATPLLAGSAPRLAALVMILGAALSAPACGSDGADVAASCPSNPMRVTTSASLSAAAFCQLYLQTCTGADNPPSGYTMQKECETAYAALMFETTRQCRSYHLCNSAAYDKGNGLLHCLHTVGMSLCADTASGM